MHQQHHDTARSVACLLAQCWASGPVLAARESRDSDIQDCCIPRSGSFQQLDQPAGADTGTELLIRCLRKSVDESS